MIYEIPPEVAAKYPSDYYNSLDYPLWIIALIIGFLGAFIFLKRRSKADNEIQKTHFTSLMYLFFFLSVTRICYTVAVKVEGFNYDFYITLGYIFSMIGLTFFLYNFENSIIKKTHHSLTIICVIGLTLAFLGLLNLINRDIPRITNGMISLGGSLAVIIIHIILISRSTGAIRTKAIMVTIGILLLFLGVVGDSELVYEFFPNLLVIIPPVIRIIGTVMVIASQKID